VPPGTAGPAAGGRYADASSLIGSITLNRPYSMVQSHRIALRSAGPDKGGGVQSCSTRRSRP
jgi:hypothetical protein